MRNFRGDGTVQYFDYINVSILVMIAYYRFVVVVIVPLQGAITGRNLGKSTWDLSVLFLPNCM